jgi:ribose-phosphate pyrophosphokinase
MDRLKVFTGNANPALAEEVCAHLEKPLGTSQLTRFSDGESYFQILENVRGVDVFVIQPTCSPVNTNLMELLIMIDAFRRSSAGRITAVIPYYGYARQDRKDKPRVPITSKLVADLITEAGADRVERARAFAVRLNAQLAIMDKRRTAPNEAEIMHVIGDVRGRTCVIVDDIIDTAGTLAKAAAALRDHGASRIYATCSHPVFSGPAIERIDRSPIERVVATNTIPLPENKRSAKVTQLSVAELLARAITNIHKESSVSELFV